MSNVYYIYKDNKLVKAYKYKKCVYKYIDRLCNLSFDSSPVRECFYVVDKFNQIEFV